MQLSLVLTYNPYFNETDIGYIGPVHETNTKGGDAKILQNYMHNINPAGSSTESTEPYKFYPNFKQFDRLPNQY
jgi:hypothetical protein